MAIDWAALAGLCLVHPGSTVRLDQDFDPSRTHHGIGKEAGEAALAEATATLFDYQDRFYAQADRALLIVLQGIDAAGKDGTIKHVMTGLNPQDVDVFSFKAPSATEKQYGFLWRHQAALPAFGRISIFNRSHYENVVVTRVHPDTLWPVTPAEEHHGLWHRRYREINDWERYLVDNGTVVVKLFLHLSRDEQERRFLQRLDQPGKNWKFSAADLRERAFWDDYTAAFGDMLSHTSTDWAPWHVVPADHKWFSHLSTSAVLLETMRSIDPHYPTVDAAARAELAEAKAELLGLAPGRPAGSSAEEVAGRAGSPAEGPAG
ncbi:MAG TPA: PPK2 family polyphosphate kinase [Acidimicrobiales bacterium]|nr:PPK2 family polyphosphate kinase [Acidimicrobiales bacterium]